MIPPYWRDTLTVYTPSNNGSGTVWSRSVYAHCFFKASKASSYSDKQLFESCKLTARLPGSVNVTIGSIAVRGVVDDVIPDNTSGNELLRKYSGCAFRVNYTSDNSAFPPEHTWIGGA